MKPFAAKKSPWARDTRGIRGARRVTTAVLALPLGLLLGYGALRFTASAFEELRAALFARMQSACTLKGGRLSIATHGLLLALQPSPPSLAHGIATCHTSGG